MIQGHKPITIWNWPETVPHSRENISAKVSTEGLLSWLWKLLVLFTLWVGIELVLISIDQPLISSAPPAPVWEWCWWNNDTVFSENVSLYMFWLWGLRSTLSDLYKIGLRGVKITRAGNSPNKQQFLDMELQDTSQKLMAGEWEVQDS